MVRQVPLLVSYALSVEISGFAVSLPSHLQIKEVGSNEGLKGIGGGIRQVQLFQAAFSRPIQSLSLLISEVWGMKRWRKRETL